MSINQENAKDIINFHQVKRSNIVKKFLKNLLKVIDTLSPEEREEYRLEKNMKERERKRLKKQESKARG